MIARRRAALVIYAVISVGNLGFGATYLLRTGIMPYHERALGLAWNELGGELRVLLRALLEVAGAGWLALFVATAPLLATRFRTGDRVVRAVIPASLLMFYVPTLVATLDVLAGTAATPPWYGAALAIAATLLAVVLDAPWSASRPDEPTR